MPSRIGGWKSPITTSSGAELIEQSNIFACPHCFAPMNYVRVPDDGTPLMECNGCGWRCALEDSSVCAVQDDAVSTGIAVQAAQRRCGSCGGAHHIQYCPELRAALGLGRPSAATIWDVRPSEGFRAMARAALGLAV